jgi:hypothetical protein
MPDFPHPQVLDCHRRRVLDCRHGRVLALNYMKDASCLDYLVWDPVAGDCHAVPVPEMEDWLIESAAVLCATHGCDHLDCHGGPFRVVFMATHDYKPTIFACVYSSETGAWSQPISLDNSCEYYAQHMQEGLAVRSYYLPYLQPRRGTHIGDAIYNTIQLDNTIVKFDWCKDRLSLIRPPSKDVYYIALMAMDNSTLGFASILGFSLHMWSMKMDTEEAVEWLQYRVIELEKIIPVANPTDETVVVGSAEGVGVIFVSTDVGLFSIELKSGRVKKVDEPGAYFSVLPYMSFYTPGIMLALASCLLSCILFTASLCLLN